MMRRMQAKSVIIEQIESSFAEHTRVSIEIAAIEKRLSHRVSTNIYKVTFLQLVIDENDTDETKKSKVLAAADNDFLGYAIVVNLLLQPDIKKTYLVEGVIRELYPYGNGEANDVGIASPSGHYLHVKKRFACHVLAKARAYSIIGTFFAQQNSITNVCAHACALMMLNNCKGFDRLISCEEINRLLGIDHENRLQTINPRYGGNERATHEGLTSLELEKVFNHFGFKSYRQTFLKDNQRYFREFIYGFIESGYPALLTFTTTSPDNEFAAHVVAVAGHTWNPNSWLPPAFANYAGAFNPEKPYLSTLGWINDLLVHDDNFGMQLCLPAHSFRPEDNPDPGIGFTPTEAIGIFPQENDVRLLAHLAERIASGLLHQVFSTFYEDGQLPKDNYYISHLQRNILHPHTRTVVLRTSLVKHTTYLEHLKSADNRGKRYTDASRDLISSALSTFKQVWLIEVTEPDLYVGNLSKVIDIIMDPTFDVSQPNPDFRKSLIMFRFPEFLMLPKTFNKESIDYSVQGPLLEIEGHLPLLQQSVT